MEQKTYKYDKVIGKVESVKKIKETPAWTLYEVIINGQKFSAFDAEFLALQGIDGTYDFRVDEQGRKTLQALKKQKPQGSSDYRIMDALKRIEEKVDRLGELLAPEPTPADEDVVDENLPF